MFAVMLATPDPNFLEEQKKFSRVRTAVQEKSHLITETIGKAGIATDAFHVLFVAYKDEDILEVYARHKSEKRHVKVATYAICARSGELGPKRMQGDAQVPEGFYHIDRFNPASNFYLSLGINYPNASDKARNKGVNPGGDIFIHGSCVTIGCLPMTDDKIKELYLYAVYARNNGQSQIPVYIFPFRMSKENMNKYNTASESVKAFWRNLQQGYDAFQKNTETLQFEVTTTGEYLF